MKMLLNKRLLAVAMAMTLFLVWAGSAAAAQKLIPKVDNFIFFVDYSGSMGFKYMDTGEKKIELAKQVVRAVNQEIPNLDYQSSLVTFAPYSTVYPYEGVSANYSQLEYGQAVDNIITNFSIFGRQTPMGDGTKDLDGILSQLSGRTAVIIVSDGENNLGMDPVEAARDIYNRYPGSVCFHVISFATSDEGRATLDAINKLRDCSVMADGGELLGSQALAEKFARDVFYDVVKEEKPAPTMRPAPKKEPMVEEVISLRSVHFDFDKSNIRPDMRPILDEAARLIKVQRGDLVLEGHTDWTGTEEYNMGLGKRRAESVKRYLIDKGVEARRMETKSYGESQPKYTNNTREGRALNRRVELHFK